MRSPPRKPLRGVRFRRALIEHISEYHQHPLTFQAIGLSVSSTCPAALRSTSPPCTPSANKLVPQGALVSPAPAVAPPRRAYRRWGHDDRRAGHLRVPSRCLVASPSSTPSWVSRTPPGTLHHRLRPWSRLGGLAVVWPGGSISISGSGSKRLGHKAARRQFVSTPALASQGTPCAFYLWSRLWSASTASTGSTSQGAAHFTCG